MKWNKFLCILNTVSCGCNAAVHNYWVAALNGVCAVILIAFYLEEGE